MTPNIENSASPAGPRARIVERPVEAPLILVADDHEDSRFIARIVLEYAGFRVVEARTGVEALAMTRVARPAGIVLDIVMPELTGWEVARAVRAESTWDQPVIIALTALTDPSDRELSFASGCDDMLVKPVHARVLAQAVRRQLTRRALIDVSR